MQTLKEKLKEDLKVAIKSSDNLKKELIKVILGEITLEESRGASRFTLNDEGVMAILKKARKNQDITKEGYAARNEELPIFVLKEIEILDSYLPELMSEDQIKMIISQIIEDTGASSMKDMGKVMAEFNSQYAGKADNKFVSQYIKEKLFLGKL